MRNVGLVLIGSGLFALSANAQQAPDSSTQTASLSQSGPSLGDRECRIVESTAAAHQGATPAQLAVMNAADLALDNAAASEGPGAATALNITIPTVVHLVHDNGDELIGESQIIDAIAQVNEDMHAVPNPSDGFGHLQANVGYTFKLAKLDPNGNSTNGITYTQSNTTYDGREGPLQNAIRWPREKYLNIWVVNSSDGTGSGSGYSNYPGTVANGTGNEFWDGIVVSYWAMGRTGAAVSTHHKLLTHEIGHWANLKHTWGDQTEYGADNACQDDDGVTDTPNTQGNGGCGPLVSCGTQDNEQNFMDYGECSTMYTLGQAARMNSAMKSSIADRDNLWSQANLIATGLTGGGGDDGGGDDGGGDDGGGDGPCRRANACGTSNAAAGGCFCDAICVEYGDCCSDGPC